MSQTESQSSFLEDIKTWSPDTCRAQLADTLPKLIIQYSNGGHTVTKMATLKVMVGSFLPWLELGNLEEQFLTNVLPKTCQLFDDTLKKVSPTIDSVSIQEDGCLLKEKLQTLLQIILDTLECLCSCVSHIMNTLSGGALSIGKVKSLPSSMLHIIHASFHHCKDSTTIYGDHFSLVSEILSSLFKKAYSLQKSLTVLLEAVHLTSEDGDECIEVMAQVCTGFHDLCVVIGDMDSTLLVSTWRFLVKLVCKHKELLKNVLPIHPIVATLCSDIKANYDQCLRLAPHPPSTQSSQGGDEKAFAKTLKICSLCVKMLMHLLKELDGYLGPCVKEIYELILSFLSLAPPSIHAPNVFSSARSEIDRALLVCVEPLLQQLVDNTLFREAVTAVKQDIHGNCWLGRLLTLVKILQILPSCQEQTRAAWMESTTPTWEEPRVSVLGAVFRSYSNCYVELALPIKLPIVVRQGQPEQDVSLREYVVTQVCGFVAAVSASQFGVVERCLLENVVSSQLNCALLAMDVWCFLARYGTADLCASHVYLVADLLTSTPANHSPGYTHLGMLLWRLVPLMAQEHQEELPRMFPPKQHVALWRHIALPAFQEATRKAIAEDLVGHGLAQCKAWLNAEDHTYGSLEELKTGLSCISNVYRQFENLSLPVRMQLTQSVMETVTGLWEVLPLDRIKSHDITNALIDLTGLIASGLQPSDLAKVTKDLCSFLPSTSLKLRLEIINLLHRCRKVKVHGSPKLTDILAGFAELFSGVLADKNAVLHQLALQAFSAFAEETAHESVVPECLQAESTHSAVVDFLNQIPKECTSPAKTEVEWLQEQAEILLKALAKDEAVKEPRPDSADEEQETCLPRQQRTGQDIAANHTAHDECSDDQPAAKRPKREATEGEYRQAISEIQASLQAIQELKDRDQESPPPWLRTELLTLQEHILGLISDS
ncbi:uncharacterized protein C1orf112-like [Acanthaster planci]|uniref:Uncharacterized protein C1orf112-like n=1 Tax=Acanthaster planci TaxID=133434 RepID=A0A8B7YMY4_ACAPL|nr:uncharacterized protein C1orf112-like [Acanthaster planci]XP_022094622.1 uncharacterized protein C1orf112-like [Acanthaster planci]XP_022094623.1 uncharacterized protein C1orf112-like [Acanthaster planci]XP_022094624.1 uncharacterized protein C1orf112-like [Acanthaster planci]